MALGSSRWLLGRNLGSKHLEVPPSPIKDAKGEKEVRKGGPHFQEKSQTPKQLGAFPQLLRTAKLKCAPLPPAL